MNWGLVIALLCFSASSLAEVSRVEALPNLKRPLNQDLSCQVLLRRLQHLSKAHAGLGALMQRAKDKRKWEPRDFQRLESALAGVRGFPEEYHQRIWSLNVEWSLPDQWRTILDSPDRVAVRWQFKGQDWSDEWGVLPDEVVSVWHGDRGSLSVTVKVSPVEVCVVDGGLKMIISKPDSTDGELELYAATPAEI